MEHEQAVSEPGPCLLNGRRQPLEQAQRLLEGRANAGQRPVPAGPPCVTQMYRRGDGWIGMICEAPVRLVCQLALTRPLAGHLKRINAAQVQVWQVSRYEVLRVRHLLVEFDGPLPMD